MLNQKQDIILIKKKQKRVIKKDIKKSLIPKLNKLFSEIDFQKFSNSYDIIKELGVGGFAKVNLAKHKLTNTLRAIKRINKLHSNQFSIEINFLKTLDHPNIIKTFEYSKNDKFYFIVSEYCEGGDFFDFLVSNGIFNEKSAKFYFKQIVSAVNYCHKNNIIHRDIKPENILIMKDENNNNTLKLIDFGFSVKKDFIEIGTKCGSLYYIAPEVFNSEFSEKSDVWSLGVILYIMFMGKFPYKGNNLKDIELDMYNKTLDFSSLNPNLADLLSKILNKNPINRISCEEILNHIWFLNNDNNNKDNNKFVLKKLKRFHSYNLLENLIYFHTTALLLSKEETAKLSSKFNELDEDNDGKLNFSELVNAYVNIGYFLQEAILLVKKILNELNCNEEDGIEFNKFLLICCDKKKIMNKEKLINAFKYWENDTQGGLTKNDLIIVLKDIFPVESYNLISNEMDIIFKNDIINYIEFENLITKFVEDEQISQSFNINSQLVNFNN